MNAFGDESTPGKTSGGSGGQEIPGSLKGTKLGKPIHLRERDSLSIVDKTVEGSEKRSSSLRRTI